MEWQEIRSNQAHLKQRQSIKDKPGTHQSLLIVIGVDARQGQGQQREQVCSSLREALDVS